MTTRQEISIKWVLRELQPSSCKSFTQTERKRLKDFVKQKKLAYGSVLANTAYPKESQEYKNLHADWTRLKDILTWL